MITYTAITGWREELLNQPPGKYVAFLDSKIESPTWEIRKVCDLFKDPNRNAKIEKILSHRYINYEVSMWIDGNVELLQPPENFLQFLGDNDICVMPHPETNCVYQEAQSVKEGHYDNIDTVNAHMKKYEDEGISKNYGVYGCTMILRRHTPRIKLFNEFWWAEICTGSRRDQLSLVYALNRFGITHSLFPFDRRNTMDFIKIKNHL